VATVPRNRRSVKRERIFFIGFIDKWVESILIAF